MQKTPKFILLICLMSIVYSFSTQKLFAQKPTNKKKAGTFKLIKPDAVDPGLEWLKGIFICPDSDGYCLPDEQQVLTDRFWEFVVASNELNSNPYGYDEAELDKARKEHEDKWGSLYSLYDEEIWPFGRGNGGVPELQDVVVKVKGYRQYEVLIEFDQHHTSENEVTLVPDQDGFSIDYIKTKIAVHDENDQGSSLEFTQKWTWIYKDESIDEEEFGHKGEITAYYNPANKYWLMTRATYGIAGEMFAWILGKPDGTYQYLGISVHPGDEPPLATKRRKRSIPDQIPDYYTKSDATKKFTAVQSDVGEFTAHKYDFTGTMMAENKERYMDQHQDMDFSALNFLGSSFSGEPRLPYSFPEDMPADYVLLEETTKYAGNIGEAYLRLKSVTDVKVVLEDQKVKKE